MSRPGRLNKRVEIWRDPGTTQGAFGEVTEEWALLTTRLAEIQPGRGSERFADEAERATQSVVIVMRSDTTTRAITPKDRVRYIDGAGLSLEYDIHSVSDRFTRQRYVEILASHRSPEADRLP